MATLERSSSWAALAGRRTPPAEDFHASLSQPRTLDILRALAKEAVLASSYAMSPSQSNAIIATLRGELYDRLDTLQAQARVPEPLGLVRNKATGIVHRIADDSGPEVSKWSTACGWKFAAGSKATFGKVDAQPVRLYKAMCEKCLPTQREALKADLCAHLGRQGGGVTRSSGGLLRQHPQNIPIFPGRVRVLKSKCWYK